MSKRPKKGSLVKRQNKLAGYSTALVEIVELLEDARRLASRSVNAIMTAAHWEIGRRIVEIEQKGKGRADYGEQVIDRLSRDLTARLGRGFGRRNLFQMRGLLPVVQRDCADAVCTILTSDNTGYAYFPAFSRV